MNINKQFDAMFKQVEEVASAMLANYQPQSVQADEPAKVRWAMQEGFTPEYDPNADQVDWVKKPEPAYNVPDIMKVRGSMSPETFAESFPEYQVKTQHLNELLQDIYQNVLDGKITQQRGEELAYQLMADTYDEALKQGKPQGAGVKSSSEQQTASKVMKGQRLVGTK
ncbi:hypothetical protein [Kluyvera sp. CHPC 1.2972]|uniref:hypothetical protein n=1 Tax=Kluyvera sp. CHPC 1.2972 TaxID=2995176 RepID=UPI002FD7B56C